jgi:hypothetical protein
MTFTRRSTLQCRDIDFLGPLINIALPHEARARVSRSTLGKLVRRLAPNRMGLQESQTAENH